MLETSALTDKTLSIFFFLAKANEISLGDKNVMGKKHTFFVRWFFGVNKTHPHLFTKETPDNLSTN